eukprot:19833-Heterococcus_DN1.PRE.2
MSNVGGSSLYIAAKEGNMGVATSELTLSKLGWLQKASGHVTPSCEGKTRFSSLILSLVLLLDLCQAACCQVHSISIRRPSSITSRHTCCRSQLLCPSATAMRKCSE